MWIFCIYKFFFWVFRIFRLHRLGFWLVLVGSVYFVEAGEAKKDFLDQSLVLLYTKDFELMITDQGGLRYVIKADEMRQYQSGNLELKGKVNLTQLDHQGGYQGEPDFVLVQADRLFYNKALKRCIVQGHVLVQQPKICFSMATEQLSYYLDQDILSTDFPVKIQQDQSFVSGVGFFSTKDFQEFSIGEPNGAFDVLLPYGES